MEEINNSNLGVSFGDLFGEIDGFPSIDKDELLCEIFLYVRELPVGNMSFITNVVDRKPMLRTADVKYKVFKKIFISYSHKDEHRVKYIAEAYRAQGVDYFFDRHYLKGGDVYPIKIREYIDSADLFILCWSKNAAESDYVQKERLQALERAYPQVQPEKTAKLRIYPMSIEPRSELPSDMKNYYHFGTL